jgi:hypothetical protein
MRYFLICFSVLVCINNLTGQTKTDSTLLPFMGRWTGQLEIFKGQSLTQRVPMQAIHQPTDTLGVYRWVLIYGADTLKGARNYTLRTVDQASGHYVIDEGDGIMLDSYVHDNKMFSSFMVMENSLITTYERQGDELIFEVIFGKSQAVRTSGGSSEQVPEVKSYPISSYQRGVLRKQSSN